MMFLETWVLPLVLIVLSILAILIPVLLSVAYLTYAERKVIAAMHTELGRDLGDSGVTQLSQDVENLESAVDGLHSGGRVALALVVLTLRHRPRSLYAHRVRRADLLYAEPASRASTQWWNSAM